jgi:nitroimidazol reductase NimA-like FMN-containing flavoprotein (pyridoxamine 5'-phosphate oxidase superfamily)
MTIETPFSAARKTAEFVLSDAKIPRFGRGVNVENAQISGFAPRSIRHNVRRSGVLFGQTCHFSSALWYAISRINLILGENIMSEDLTTVRRQDRAVEDETWIRAFLHRAPVGTLATVSGGQPFIHMNLFVYDEARHGLYLHTARQGRTPSNIVSSAAVCFSVMEMGRLLPASVALEFSVEYASVIVFGRASLVTDEAEAAHALQLLLDKYAPHLRPGQDYRPPVNSEIKRTAVFRIDIDAWSGKKKEVAADFPGAYWYPGAPMLAARSEK